MTVEDNLISDLVTAFEQAAGRKFVEDKILFRQ